MIEKQLGGANESKHVIAELALASEKQPPGTNSCSP